MNILNVMREKLNWNNCDVKREKERRQADDPTYFGYWAPQGIERRRCGSIFS